MRVVLQLEGVLAPPRFIDEVLRPYVKLSGGPPDGADRSSWELTTWERALSGGAFYLNLYRDVWHNLKRLRGEGHEVAVISDVSAAHLEVLLRYTSHGDGNRHVSARIGPEHGDPADPATWAALGATGALFTEREAVASAARAAGWEAPPWRRSEGATLDLARPGAPPAG
jgi:hypothetical protein